MKADNPHVLVLNTSILIGELLHSGEVLLRSPSMEEMGLLNIPPEVTTQLNYSNYTDLIKDVKRVVDEITKI